MRGSAMGCARSMMRKIDQSCAQYGHKIVIDYYFMALHCEPSKEKLARR